MAGDLVNIAVHAGVNEAVVKAFGAAPLDHLGRGGLILERRVVGSVWGSIDADGREMAVSTDGRSESADKGSSLDLVRHVDGCWKVGFDEKVWCSKASFEVNEVCSKEYETLQAC